MEFDITYVRSILLRDKGLLYELFQNNQLQNRTQISGLEDVHLKTILIICHLIANNEIPLFEEDFLKIKQARKMTFMKTHFKDRKKFSELINSPRSEIVKILENLSSVYSCLFSVLFEEV
jgi:hypothetical protein